MIDTPLATKYAKFVINEIVPRAKKMKTSPEDFIPPSAAALIFRLELQGLTYRKHTREFLDYLLDKSKTPSDMTVKIMNTIVLMYYMSVENENAL